MATQRLTLLRVQKQQRALQKQPLPNMIVQRKGALSFHFCIYGLDGPYEGGFYHGVLELASDYPFSPPQIKFFTQSGRFQTNKAICTTFTNYHKQQWSSAWNVKTMLLGILSFMNQQGGGLGSMNSSYTARRKYAQNSLRNNMQSALFRQLFEQKIRKIKSIDFNNRIQASQSGGANKSKAQSSNQIYFLFIILILVCIVYGVVKNSSSSESQSFSSRPFNITQQV